MNWWTLLLATCVIGRLIAATWNEIKNEYQKATLHLVWAMFFLLMLAARAYL